MIKTTNLTYAYPGESPVLENINLTISSGSFVALMGKNGAGKTTLALLLKGLLVPVSGTAAIDGLYAVDGESRFEIMKRVGMVFQNPDNTIVATTVERELAFGLENMSMPPGEMKERVDEALRRFDLERYRHTNPSHLSGGEKQRLALAAVLVMHPEHLILDEPTSLLDPWSRGHILEMIHAAADEGTTVIHITRFVSEAENADRVLVLDESGICLDGPPEKVLMNSRFKIQDSRLKLQEPAFKDYARSVKSEDKVIIDLNLISHIYDKGTPFENRALTDISLKLPAGSSTALIGASGSGKTTLLEIAAGVTMPTQGQVQVKGSLVRAMAFQFPEDQMFGDTVESYVEFGPNNMGVKDSDLHDAVTGALEDVGLDPELFLSRDPLNLSGGEKRRAALAGVLAMKPDALILDEPTAGLDSEGVELILAFLGKYVNEGGTLLFSTHDFEIVRNLADFALVLESGRVEIYGCVDEVFEKSARLNSLED